MTAGRLARPADGGDVIPMAYASGALKRRRSTLLRMLGFEKVH